MSNRLSLLGSHIQVHKFQVLWDAICHMLLHPHSWIRNRSVHLIAHYFKLVAVACKESPQKPDAWEESHQKPDACEESPQKSLASFYLMSPSRLFHIAASLCCQLKTPLIEYADANLMNQSISFVICKVHAVMGQISPVDPFVFWSALEQHEKDRFLKAFDLLDSRMERSLFLFHTSSVPEQSNQQNANNIQYVLVSALLKKLGKIALRTEIYQMGIVFQSFESIMSQMSRDDCLHYAYDVLLPLYKVSKGLAGKEIPEETKELVEKRLEGVRNNLGDSDYWQVLSRVVKKLDEKRDKRRQEERIVAVTNPMRHAKRKMRISARKQANKKRKILASKKSR